MSTTPIELILQESADYSNKSLIISQPGRNANYTVKTLHRGLVLFRGEHTDRKEPGREVPAYFSDMLSAGIYTRGDHTRLFAFRVKKAPKLIELSYATLVGLIQDDRLTDEERAVLDQYLQIEGDTPYIIPVGFFKRTDAEGEHKLYLNRRVLNLICRLGYDGWIVLPDSLIQRNLDTAHYKETGQLRYRLNPYNPEIALCKWAEFLEPLK